MVKRRVLVSWIGFADYRAMAASLKGDERNRLLAKVGDSRIAGCGPIRTLTDGERFSEIHLLSTQEPHWDRKFVTWLGKRATFHTANLASVIDYSSIYSTTNEILSALRDSGTLDSAELCMHLSPGTPAMAAVMLLLGTSIYPATFFQTHDNKVIRTEVPFDIYAEFLPSILKAPDAHWQHLASLGQDDVGGFASLERSSAAMKMAIGLAVRTAPHNVPILLLGESGTGKELFARAIHNASGRSGPFVAVNCAGVPQSLFEAELFGAKKGIATGVTTNVGLFEAADGGTLFLDEIGECAMESQAKLLRSLQPLQGEDPCTVRFRRVGENRERVANVRVIAATNRDLISTVRRHEFRDDLYYRIAVVSIKLPALRDRRSDIPTICASLLDEINETLFGSSSPNKKAIAPQALRYLQKQAWPGNVRQLRNALLQATVMSEGGELSRADVAAALSSVNDPDDSNILNRPMGGGFRLEEVLREVRIHYLRRAIAETNGNQKRAGELLGISQQSVSQQQGKYVIDQP